jgi:hypothetical protein
MLLIRRETRSAHGIKAVFEKPGAMRAVVEEKMVKSCASGIFER